MDFLLPFIDDKNIIRKVKPIIKSPQSTTTVTVLKKSRPEEETILYTNSAPSTITYSLQTVASSSKDSSSQELKVEAQQQAQDIQQFYNHAGLKVIGEDYITTYPSGEQLIYQTTSGPTVEEIQQQQQQEIMQHEAEQNECVQQESPSKQQMTNATIIPIPNVSNVFSSTNPNEASDLYFLIGLLPDFRNLSHDTKRKVKIGILRLLDDAVST